MAYPFQINSLEQYYADYKRSVYEPEAFWSSVAQHFEWRKRWDKVLQWNFVEPSIEWFAGAELNITENCIDRHAIHHADQLALIWEANNPSEQSKTFTYSELQNEVCRLAQVLINIGVKKGDRVCIYMGMIPELAFAVLACARIGAIHSVIFGGFSAQSVKDRLQDAQIEFILCCDGAYRGNKKINLKSIVDEAVKDCDFVKKILVFNRIGEEVTMKADRDLHWQNELNTIPERHFVPFEIMNAEDKLFILYTSGSTGKPKGVVHTCAGYMLWAAYTFVNVFQYNKNEIHFCTADIGWITGHTYIIYGPLLAGATTMLFEGIPTWPDAGRYWDIVDKHKVNILYTAPTAIRSLMSFGDLPIQNKNLSSLRLLGSVGEPINEEAWNWFYEKIGKKKCAIVDTWWQTETGGILISNLGDITPAIPSWATKPLPGVQLILVDDDGNENTEVDEHGHVSGNLCIKFPWPGIMRTTYGDHERCRKNYFDQFKNLYFSGDAAFRDQEGNYRITGRVDDVLKISGHRIGTAEVENAINLHEVVIESAVVGFPHAIKGEAIYAFVILAANAFDENSIRNQIIETVSENIGPIAKPDKIQFVSGLPKTRSGKIMRRILRKIAKGETDNLGDTSTLLDPQVVNEIIKNKGNL